MSDYLGDFPVNSTIYHHFNSHKADGTPITWATTPAVSIYKDDNTTEVTTGVTLTVDFDSRTGLHNIKIIMTDAFYATGHDYSAVITGGTVDSIAVTTYVVCHWSIEHGSAFSRLGAPAGASTAADIAAVKALLPAALDASGYMKSSLESYKGTVCPTADTAGYPKVTIKDGTGTGEIDTLAGAVILQADQNVNVTKWNGSNVATPVVTGAPVVTLASAQAAYTPAKAGDKMDLVDALNTTAAIVVADQTLKRDWTAITGEPSSRSLWSALRAIRNKWTILTGTITYTKEDDTTQAWQADLTGTSGADPITGFAPK